MNTLFISIAKVFVFVKWSYIVEAPISNQDSIGNL